MAPLAPPTTVRKWLALQTAQLLLASLGVPMILHLYPCVYELTCALQQQKVCWLKASTVGHENVVSSTTSGISTLWGTTMSSSVDCRAADQDAFHLTVLNSMMAHLLMLQTACEVSSIVLMLKYLLSCPMTQALLVETQIVYAVRPFKQV